MIQQIQINSSDVETRPYVFDPYAQIIATDNASLGDMLYIKREEGEQGSGIRVSYYYVSEADTTCKIYQGNPLEHDEFRYLYGVNDLCVRYEVHDEAGNIRAVYSKITVKDNTIPSVSYDVVEIILQIGDDMPTNDQLIAKFGLEVSDNSLLFTPNRPMEIVSDLSGLNLSELGVYDIFVTAVDGSGNKSVPVKLVVTVTVRILNI